MKLTYGVKKLLSVLSAISIAVCCLPFAAAADDNGDNYEWKIENKTLIISPQGKGIIPDFDKPSDTPWNYRNSSIYCIEIKSGISRIGNNAFKGLANVGKYNNSNFNVYYTYGGAKIADTVTSIGDSAFENCTSLRYAKIPNSVQCFGERVYSGCTGLTDAYLPTRMSGGEIPDFMFYGCEQLKKLTINEYPNANRIYLPTNVTRIGKYAFSGCKSLVSSTSQRFDSIDAIEIDDFAFENCVGLKWMQLILSTKYFNGSIFSGCSNLAYVNIYNLGWSDYHSMDGYALFNKDKTKLIKLFHGESATEYTVPESVNIIGKFAFDSCKFENITVGANVSEIEEYAFNNCKNLTSVTVSDNVTKIGHNAFKGCVNLTELNIPRSVNKIEQNAFGFDNGIKTVNYDGTEEEFERIAEQVKVNKNAIVYCLREEFTRGDVNKDKAVDILDLIAIKKSISDYGVANYQSDIVGDGYLNAEDMAALRKMILGL